MIGWALGIITSVYVLLSFLMWYLTPVYRADRKAAVVVLGDIGHSPRMCFHTLSIAKVGCPVDLIGYVRSDIMPELNENPLIRIRALPEPVKRGNMPYIMYAFKRALKEHISLYRLLKKSNPTVVLVQNPPSIPTLGVARLITLFTFPGSKLLIDWHNLGYSILAMSQKGLAVRLYRAYEMIFGRIAYLHLCVSVRLGMALKTGFAINPKKVMPLYDRPYKQYKISGSKRVEQRKRLGFGDVDAPWIVTSTSYTPDEDLTLLLDALEDYSGPKLVCVITGKGPMKDDFLKDVEKRTITNAKIVTAWLPYEDYHTLLAVCDLGISFHKSSSGFDLPMKIVDMFGACLPVLAMSYQAIGELVNENNGITFKDKKELLDGLEILEDTWKLAELKKGATLESQLTWDALWAEKVGPVFGYGEYTGEESSSSDSD